MQKKRSPRELKVEPLPYMVSVQGGMDSVSSFRENGSLSAGRRIDANRLAHARQPEAVTS